ncbi:hypothetical protein [Mariniblastus fucicola]|nr:hypothetical protein [Mariniblastus fucicola]
MGEFRFRLPSNWEPTNSQAKSIHVIGLDGVPSPCRVSSDEGILTIARNRDESGKVFLAFPFEDFGEFTIGTGTLPESQTPYQLLIELARGTLNRLRNQISIWQEGGLEIAEEVHDQVGQATRLLSQAIMQTDPAASDQGSRDALHIAMSANLKVSEQFGAEVSKYRTSQPDMPRFWFANAVGADEVKPEHCEAEPFQLVQAAPELADAAAEAGNKRTIVGPFLDASPGGMQEEIVALDDFFARRDYILNRCRKTIRQLNPSSSLLHVVSGLNGMGHRHLSYPQQTQITSDMLNLIDESQIDVPMMVSFDYPWAERLATAVGGAHPLQIADSLLRQGVPINFIGLDVNLDYWPCGSVVRDPLQWIDMIDIWSQLGLPLIFCFRMPTMAKPAIPRSGQLINEVRSELTDEQRLSILETLLPMMIARPGVHGFIWRQWKDSDDERFPGGGLVTETGDEKPVLELLRNVSERIYGSK